MISSRLTGSTRIKCVEMIGANDTHYGYAVTSPSSQGQTVDRVIINADARETPVLLNRRSQTKALMRALPLTGNIRARGRRDPITIKNLNGRPNQGLIWAFNP